MSSSHGEIGWAESDETSWTPVSSVILLLATLAYSLATWALAGLHPLAGFASRFGFLNHSSARPWQGPNPPPMRNLSL
jgi:hypothetical protein